MFRICAVIVLIACAGLMAGCGDDPKQGEPQPATPRAVAGGGSVRVSLQPEQPTSSDCLRAVVGGQSEKAVILWEVNGQRVSGNNQVEFCGNPFSRGDQVIARVGTASASVTIGNSLPRVTGISSTPKELYAGMDVTVVPEAEDKDGDPVEFRYQWLINGEADPFLTEATLPGDRFSKGDKVQVKITPYDGFAEGPVYESYVTPIPNAAPKILTQPPPRFETLDYAYPFKAKDPDGDPLTYSLEKAPEGMTINPATGQINWPLRGVKPGTYQVKIVVRDPEGIAVFQEYTLTLGAPVAQPIE